MTFTIPVGVFDAPDRRVLIQDISKQANKDKIQSVIWAAGLENPGDSAVDAYLVQHVVAGNFTLNLTKPIATHSVNGSQIITPPISNSTYPTGSADIPLENYQKMIIAHALFCAIGFLFMLPLGGLLARYIRTFYPVWFRLHWIFQFAIGGHMYAYEYSIGTHYSALQRVLSLVQVCFLGIYPFLPVRQ